MILAKNALTIAKEIFYEFQSSIHPIQLQVGLSGTPSKMDIDSWDEFNRLRIAIERALRKQVEEISVHEYVPTHYIERDFYNIEKEIFKKNHRNLTYKIKELGCSRDKSGLYDDTIYGFHSELVVFKDDFPTQP